MPGTWPPAPAPGDEYADRPVRDHPEGVRRVPCRRVVLWGQPVWLHDATGRVWCPCCFTLVNVAELGRPDNSHPVGLPVRQGVLLPMAPDDGPGQKQRTPWDLEW